MGWGGGTHRSWPGGRGGRPRALVAGEGWGFGEGWGLVGCSKKGKSREGLACLAVPQEGARARAGIQGLWLWKGRWVGVLFLESWRVDLVTCSGCLVAWRGKGSGGVQWLRFREG